MNEARSLPAVIAARAREAPERPFLAMAGHAMLSVGEMELRSRRVGNGLRELGVGFGDRVLVMLPNCVEFVEAWFASNRLGAAIVTVNTAYRGAFLEHVVNNAKARLMIVAAAFVDAVLASAPAMPTLDVLVVVGDHGDRTDIPRRMTVVSYLSLHQAGEGVLDAEVAAHHLSAIVYTSGTSGPSKGVMLPHGQMYMNPYVYLEQLGIDADDVMYCALPLFHTNALTLQVYGALIARCRVVVAPQFSASRWLSDIRQARATVTNLLGAMTEFVLRQPASDGDRDHALRILNAVPIVPALGARFEQRFGVRLVELYGSTEANCPLFQPRGKPRRDGSCGKVVSRWFECRIADPATDEPVPTGEVGELLIRPKTPHGFMMGYYGMPEETVAAWRNLWFHSGDAMRQDADGYFYFVDRLKDCIRRRGENISSYEVEQAVLAHPDVEVVAAVGVASPDDAQEQEVKLCVARKPGRTLGAAELHEFCRTRLPAFAVPRYIEFYDDLPQTPTQKVQKKVLRDAGITAETWVAPDAGGRAARRST